METLLENLKTTLTEQVMLVALIALIGVLLTLYFIWRNLKLHVRLRRLRRVNAGHTVRVEKLQQQIAALTPADPAVKEEELVSLDEIALDQEIEVDEEGSAEQEVSATRKRNTGKIAKVEDGKEKSVGFVVTFDRLKNTWVIKKKGADRATRRADTKEEAVKIAKQLSQKYNVSLSLKKKDGRFQKQ